MVMEAMVAGGRGVGKRQGACRAIASRWRLPAIPARLALW
ncbi:hypothetical protein F0726_00694 [Acidithiobacillus caldus]|nr:hypothetical protein F0726_00694 [Acidithiobacillus caldus]